MKRHTKAATAAVLIAALTLSGQAGFAASKSASTPVYLTIKASQIHYDVPSRPNQPDTTDYTYFSDTEKENYQKLSEEGKKLVLLAKSVTPEISSANSTLHKKRAIVVSWKNQKTSSGEALKWNGTEIFRSLKADGKPMTPFFTVKNKNWYKNNKNIKINTKYYYRVRSYVIVEGYRFYSRESSVTGTLAQHEAKYSKAEAAAQKRLSKTQKAFAEKVKKATIKLTAVQSSGKATLSWQTYEHDRAKDAKIKWDGVEIYRSKTALFTGMKPVTTVKKGKTKYSEKKKSMQNYYRVRAYKVIGGQKYYSQYSETAVLNRK